MSEMNAEPHKDWRDVIHAYLQAIWDDEHRRFEASLSGSEARFLQKYGADPIMHGYEEAAKERCDSLVSPPPPESYDLLEESAHRVIAQVCPGSNWSSSKIPVPFESTRFLLTKGDTGWQIAGIYRPCVYCNFKAIRNEPPRMEPGKCSRCQGTGERHSGEVQVRGFWPFKRLHLPTEPCTHCGGTGKCPDCAQEDVPGWQSVFSACGLGRTAKKA